MNNQFLKITLMAFMLCGVALADIKDFIGVEIGKTTPNNLKKLYGPLQGNKDKYGYDSYSIDDNILGTSGNIFSFNNGKLDAYILFYTMNNKFLNRGVFFGFCYAIDYFLDNPKQTRIKLPVIQEAVLLDNGSTSVLLTFHEDIISITVSSSSDMPFRIKNMKESYK